MVGALVLLADLFGMDSEVNPLLRLLFKQVGSGGSPGILQSLFVVFIVFCGIGDDLSERFRDESITLKNK